MAGYSLHIGLNKVQQRHIPRLRGCVRVYATCRELCQVVWAMPWRMILRSPKVG